MHLISYFSNVNHTFWCKEKMMCNMVCAIFKANRLAVICTISVLYQQ